MISGLFIIVYLTISVFFFLPQRREETHIHTHHDEQHQRRSRADVVESRYRHRRQREACLLKEQIGENLNRNKGEEVITSELLI